MFTSQSEYRLLLRNDNADERLMGLGHELGLVGGDEHARWAEYRRRIDLETSRLDATRVSWGDVQATFPELDTSDRTGSIALLELLRRPEVGYAELAPLSAPALLEHPMARRLEIEVKYRGYIDRERGALQRREKMEARRIPESLWDTELRGVSTEGVQALRRVRPANVGQASRVRGVSPADVSVVLVRLEEHVRREQERV